MTKPKGEKMIKIGTPVSQSVALAALVAVVLAIIGAAIYLPADNQFEQRLGIIMLICSVVLPAIVASVRGDKSATVSESTKQDTERLANGHLETIVRTVVADLLVQHDADVHGHLRELPKPPQGA